ncbi:MAG: alpha/beta fold hydrolase [Chloroflexi bacterium]|nr:alpha/beta fold hydrolase [Chloroflexota bacterium]
MTRFTSGPVRIAYDPIGSGDLTLVVIPGWVSHLEYDWATPEIRSFYDRLAASRCVIRYDKRGLGLSDRPTHPETYSLDIQVSDLAAVLDAAGVGNVALFGWSTGGPVALAFGAKYPERVSHLVLYGTFARLIAAPEYPFGPDSSMAQAILTIVQAEWGLGSRTLADLFIPEADLDRLAWFTAYQRIATSPQAAADSLAYAFQLDVRDLLPSVNAHALVLHRREDCLVPFKQGVYLAEHLPQARFQELSGQHHTPYFGDSEAVTKATDDFLRAETAEHATVQPLSIRELEVLRLVAEGLQNRDIALRLTISSATVSRHLANIYTKLGVSTRSSAAAYAFRRGLV